MGILLGRKPKSLLLIWCTLFFVNCPASEGLRIRWRSSWAIGDLLPFPCIFLPILTQYPPVTPSHKVYDAVLQERKESVRRERDMKFVSPITIKEGEEDLIPGCNRSPKREKRCRTRLWEKAGDIISWFLSEKADRWKSASLFLIIFCVWIQRILYDKNKPWKGCIQRVAKYQVQSQMPVGSS